MKSIAWSFIVLSSIIIGFVLADLTNSDFVNVRGKEIRVDTLLRIDTVKVPLVRYKKVPYYQQKIIDPIKSQFEFMPDSSSRIWVTVESIEVIDIQIDSMYIQPPPVIKADTTYVKTIETVTANETSYLSLCLSFLGGIVLSALLFK